MMRRVIASIVCSLVILQSVGDVVSAYDVPAYEGLVSDYAEVLSPQFEVELTTELEQLAEQDNGYEIAVVTLKSLRDEAAALVAEEYYTSWKIGKNEADDGALLLIAIDDQKVFLHTGEGLKSLITDVEADAIIKEEIDPAFQQAAYEQGVTAAIARMRQELTDQMFGNINPINKSPGFMKQFIEMLAISGMSIISISFFTYFSAWYGRNKTWWPGGLVGAGVGTLLGGAAAGIFFGVLGLALDYQLSKKHRRHA